MRVFLRFEVLGLKKEIKRKLFLRMFFEVLDLLG